jgi:hypothetical protein
MRCGPTERFTRHSLSASNLIGSSHVAAVRDDMPQLFRPNLHLIGHREA